MRADGAILDDPDRVQGADRHTITSLWGTHWTGKGTHNVRSTVGMFEHRSPLLCGIFMVAMYILVRSDVEAGWTRKWVPDARNGPKAGLLFEAPLHGSRSSDELRKDQGANINKLLKTLGVVKLGSTHLGHATVQQMGNQLGLSNAEIDFLVGHKDLAVMTGHYVGQDFNTFGPRAKLCGHSGAEIICPRAQVSERKRPGELTRWVASRMELSDDALKQALAGVLLSGLPFWPDESFEQWAVVKQLKQLPGWPSHRDEVLLAEHQNGEDQGSASSPSADQQAFIPGQIPADFAFKIKSVADVSAALHNHTFQLRGSMEKHLQGSTDGKVKWAKGPGRRQWMDWQRLLFLRLREIEAGGKSREEAVQVMESERGNGRGMAEYAKSLRLVK